MVKHARALTVAVLAVLAARALFAYYTPHELASAARDNFGRRCFADTASAGAFLYGHVTFFIFRSTVGFTFEIIRFFCILAGMALEWLIAMTWYLTTTAATGVECLLNPWALANVTFGTRRHDIADQVWNLPFVGGALAALRNMWPQLTLSRSAPPLAGVWRRCAEGTHSSETADKFSLMGGMLVASVLMLQPYLALVDFCCRGPRGVAATADGNSIATRVRARRRGARRRGAQ